MKHMLSVVVLAVAFQGLADGGSAVPEPAFAFKYDGRDVKGNASAVVDARLKVTVERQSYSEFDATEWVLWFENPSTEKSGILSDIHDADYLVALPKAPSKFAGEIGLPGERAVTTMKGCVDGRCYSVDDRVSSLEFMPVTHYFHPWNTSTFSRENSGGRSSDGEAPFFEIAQDGMGAMVALGWTGDWKATFSNGADGVRVAAGLRNARFYLEPGERLRTCRILVMNYAKGEDAGNKFRRLIRRHFSHVASHPGSRESLFAYELWGGLPTAEMVRRLTALKARGLTFEDVWIDAGWYGASKKCDDAYSGDWGAWTGDWKVNSRIHPDGLASVRDAARAIGAGIMLWIEPERVVGSSAFAREHGDLLLTAPGMGNNRLLYYGNESGRAHVRDTILALAERLDFSCYRQDFNMGVTSYFAANDAKDRRGITEIRHVLGLYRLWDELLERRPGLLIDNCASGGRRLDLETLRRSVFFFRSDYQCAFNANADVMQCHNASLARLIPLGGCTTKVSDLYSLRSAYSSSLGVAYWNAVFQDEKKVDWAAAKKSHDEYLRIRRYFPCDFYNHGSARFDPAGWAVWQYHDPASRSGIVMAFRRAESPCDRAQVALKGLPADCRFSLENLDTGAVSESGTNLEIVLPARRSSVVYVYTCNVK